jgi:hypothetical protein
MDTSSWFDWQFLIWLSTSLVYVLATGRLANSRLVSWR